jgi:hypothetical protein
MTPRPRRSAARTRVPAVRWLTRLMLLAGIAACSGRERTNPFDPSNPRTGGEPRAASAVAACRRVDLQWDAQGMRDVSGFRLYRALGAGVESLLTVTPLAPQTRSYGDTGLVNGERYRYTVEVLFGATAARCAPVFARPGAALVWCADPCGFGLQRLAPDAGAVWESGVYGTMVYDVDIDAIGHRVFAADPGDPGGIWVQASDGGGVPAVLASPGATAVSWSDASRALAVGAFYRNTATWMTDAGVVLHALRFTGAKRFFPEALAFRDSSCTWIALSDSLGVEGRVLRVDIAAARIDTIAGAFVRPVAIADDAGRGCWVADRGGAVFYVGDDLNAMASGPGAFEEPTDLATDGAGRCWVADRGAGALVRVDRGAMSDLRVEGLAGAHGVACDPVSGELWVTLPQRGEVVVVRAVGVAGEVLGRASVSGCASEIAGDWGGGCP